MIPRYQVLARRIEQELLELETIRAAIERHWVGAATAASDQDAYLNSVALGLHAFYSGLERIFKLIAIEVDGGRLGGEAWHTELVRQMTVDVPEIRPAVLRPETAANLDEYRRFRHLIRNIYATSLDPMRAGRLVTQLPALWSNVRQDIETFVRFLYGLNRGSAHS